MAKYGGGFGGGMGNMQAILKQAPIQNHDRREGRHAELTCLQYRIARMQVME